MTRTCGRGRGSAPWRRSTAPTVTARSRRTGTGITRTGRSPSGGAPSRPATASSRADAARRTGSFTTTWEAGRRTAPTTATRTRSRWVRPRRPTGRPSPGRASDLGCTDCHQAPVFGGTGLSPKHERHVSTYGYGCVRCHVNTAASNTAIVTGGGQHVDGSRDVDFDGSRPNNNVGGTYDGVAYKCSNTYCHSGGADRDGATGTRRGRRPPGTRPPPAPPATASAPRW